MIEQTAAERTEAGGSRVRGLLLDLDGTVTQDDELLPGAGEAVAVLREAGLPFLFVTNTTRRSRASLAERLRGLGIDVDPGRLLTAPRAAAAWLRGRGARRVTLFLPRDTWVDFEGLELAEERPDHVVVGDLGEAWDYATLNRAFRLLLGGAELVAIHRNRIWERADGPALDVGPFVAALEHASGRRATVVGKPSRQFFRTAVGELGLEPHEVAMVGDDLESDVGGARAADLLGVAVRTGKFRHQAGAGEVEADAVLDSIAALPAWLGLARGKE